ncbi:hypothetical protein BM524_04520 [Alteromonas mediterranea]|uniref:Sugar transferase n=1 Tax=Alteromonas mediterranea TaxID=314275 RepID=A0AAC9NR65_9ALTE|nr:hypothetical protein [Alteromonas mediterranea]APD89134.1 hypothetical protein BM524_04520 [Alteromonas mediterranea]
MSLAPVIVFAYNRRKHLMKTIHALAKCELAVKSRVIVMMDGPKLQEDKYIQERILYDLEHVNGFASLEVRCKEKNVGLEQNISTGISAIMAECGRAIVLEDDILVSPQFLLFMNNALKVYENEKRVWHISGWNFPIQTTDLPSCFLWRTALGWGWATWADRWQHYKREPEALIQRWDQIDIEEFNLYGSYNFWDQVLKNASGQIHTWAVFWYGTIFEHGGLCLNPTKAMTTNIGFDGTGTHDAGTEFTIDYDPDIDYAQPGLPTDLSENRKVVNTIIQYNRQLQSERQLAQIQTNKNLKRLIQVALSEQYVFPALTGKSVAIFGIAELSITVSQLLKAKSVSVCAFLVSKTTTLADIEGIPVVKPEKWECFTPQIVINCIEGSHENSITDSLNLALPDCKVMSWRSL